MGKTEKKKILKGDFGYIKAQRKIEIIKTAILLILPFALYFLGYITTGSNQNLLTFVAVLGCLPMASAAIQAVLFVKAKPCSEDVYKKIVGSGVIVTYYDLYFTSYKKNFQVSALFLWKNTLIALTEDDKMVLTEGEEHLKGILSNCGGDNITVKFYTDADKFIERARELTALGADERDYSFIYDNIMSVSI